MLCWELGISLPLDIKVNREVTIKRLQYDMVAVRQPSFLNFATNALSNNGLRFLAIKLKRNFDIK